MAKDKTEEQKQVESAPIVETPEHVSVKNTDKAKEPTEAEKAAAELEARVKDFIDKQFGGVDENDEGTGEPQEGVEKLPDFVREQIIEADRLETEYRSILTRKEANRTLLRALSDMGQIPTDVPSFYYPPRQRKGKNGDASNG